MALSERSIGLFQEYQGKVRAMTNDNVRVFDTDVALADHLRGHAAAILDIAKRIHK
jgi:hypothetical protein